jgi:hypothetical protein
MWSDPEDIETWAVSPRGAGWLFGRKVTSEFNQINGEWAEWGGGMLMLPVMHAAADTALTKMSEMQGCV